LKITNSLGLVMASLLLNNLSFPAFAKPIGSSPQIEITYSDKLENEFRTNYGLRERRTIDESIRQEIAEQSNPAIARVVVNVIDVTPNRPTFNQLGSNPSLSYESFSRGGAVITGSSYDANGNLLRQTSYDYTTTDIWEAQRAWVWQDTDYAIYRFVNRLTRN